MWPAASRPGARMFSQPAWWLWPVVTPTHPTQGRRIAGPREVGAGYIVEKLFHPGRSLKMDGDSGPLQDGEGWTPRRLHQSMPATTTIYYRPLSSEELVAPNQ
jgi:hypothetical protein